MAEKIVMPRGYMSPPVDDEGRENVEALGIPYGIACESEAEADRVEHEEG